MERDRMVLERVRQGTLELEGMEVLRWSSTLPNVEDRGGCRRFNRMMDHIGRVWERRWGEGVYWLACLDWVHGRDRGRTFQPWQSGLEGRVTRQTDTSISVRMEATERRSDRRINVVTWGENWDLTCGRERSTGELFPGIRKWRDHALDCILTQGREMRREDRCLLDRDWERRAAELLPRVSPYENETGVVFEFPQGALAPAVEGTPAFVVPRTLAPVQGP